MKGGKLKWLKHLKQREQTGLRSAVGNASDCRSRDPLVRSPPAPILLWRLIIK